MSRSTKDIYTPRTSGVLTVQLEFDFGPDFAGVQGESDIETKSLKEHLANLKNKAVSLKTEETNNGL
ncbi:hypothetical protein ISG33_12940 [Glaciecola sp. MH2013]|uniref:hypothetical protein n=1 Tax=Glaciecola sp. MH2013 TaxID=2785524 RepID=UPI00189F2992|nr:hypothetical protein [Glaciecola sp. MH2013]MBF7074306.1 hypothetical protein [Glaciecola sp. MH2013]